MAYDEALAGRVRDCLKGRAGVAEKKMFGGLAFLLRGKMFLGVLGRDLMVRVGPEVYERALAQPHVRPMDFTGRPMKGYVFVGPKGCATKRALAPWLARSLEFAASLKRR